MVKRLQIRDQGEDLRQELIERLVARAEFEPDLEKAGVVLAVDPERRREIAEKLVDEKFPHLV